MCVCCVGGLKGSGSFGFERRIKGAEIEGKNEKIYRSSPDLGLPRKAGGLGEGGGRDDKDGGRETRRIRHVD